jgi:hypothetical protein
MAGTQLRADAECRVAWQHYSPKMRLDIRRIGSGGWDRLNLVVDQKLHLGAGLFRCAARKDAVLEGSSFRSTLGPSPPTLTAADTTKRSAYASSACSRYATMPAAFSLDVF